MDEFSFNLLSSRFSKFGFIFVIVSGLLGVTNSQSCLDGWNFYNNQCYFISNINSSFYDARDSCAQMGSTLASVTNNATYSFLWNIIRPSWSNASCYNTMESCIAIVGEGCTTGTASCNIPACRNAGCTQFWVGLYKYNTTCNGCLDAGPSGRQGWSWLKDNTTYDSTSGWNNWYDKKPTGGNPCARLGVFNQTLAGYFGDSVCSSIFNYICQMSAIPMSVSSTRNVVISTTSSTHTTNSTSAGSIPDLPLIVGLSVGVTLGVLLVISIIIVVIIARRRRKNGSSCNTKSCFRKRKAEVPPQYTNTFKRSLQPCSRATLRGDHNRAYQEPASDPYDVIDPYGTTSTRVGDQDNEIYPYSETKAGANDDVDSINPYSVHNPLPDAHPGIINDYVNSDLVAPTSNMPVYSEPDKTRKKTQISGFFRGIQKRFSTMSQDLGPVYSIPNKPGMNGNTMNI